MASHHPSPPGPMQMHHGPPGAPPPGAPQAAQWAPSRAILQMNEAVWCQIGRMAETLGEMNEAMAAYEQALRHNPQSIPALNASSSILRSREDFPKAAEYLHTIVKLDSQNGEAWGSLGHCYLMMDNLQEAYAAYQNAVMNLNQPKDPRLWYGIGILYDRYGSLEHAEEAFSQVMKMQPDFDKAHEIYFRLGIIYKQQQKFNQSLECFNYIVNNPPAPLNQEDIWFQIGHVHEQQKDYDMAKRAYERVLERDPNHAKVLQQLGWLYHMASPAFESQDKAIDFLEKSVAADNNDAQSWYLLGRCYMGQQKYPKAYEAYQQAVYRDGRNPTFWCSIGVLYYQINQYRDALDAYSRAIRLNPFISEVWYDLGTLYESCNNQINDALDAYQRAAELDPANPHIKARLQLLQNGGANGAPPGAAPMPTDVQLQPYHNGPSGPPGPQWAGSAPQHAPQQNGPPPPGPGPSGWGRINDINPPPQPPNPYASDREPFRGPAPPLPRQPSPREQMRPYPGPPEPSRGLEPARRGPSPSSSHYPPPPPPPPPPLQQQQQQQHQQQHQQLQQQQQQRPQPPQQQGPPPPPGSQAPQPPRMPNPSYGGLPPSAAAHPPQQNGTPGPSHMLHAAYRTGSPMNNGRPPMHDNRMPDPRMSDNRMPDNRMPDNRMPDNRMPDNRMPSPKSAYPQHQASYPPHPEQAGPSGPESAGPHQPPSGTSGDGAMHRDHDHRPPSVPPKRLRDWEDERDPKKPASDENRARLDDIRHRRPSTPPRDQHYRRNSSEVRRFEDQRRMEEQRRVDEQRRAEEMRRADEQRHPAEAYHPSEAAHHQPAHSAGPHLPPMNQGPSQMQNILHDGPPSGPAPKNYPPAVEERGRMDHPPVLHTAANEPERAARKMDVDEDYDDSGEEDKKGGIVTGTASGPASASGDMKTGTPTTANMNGIIGPKTEGP